jgi:hypothetical protein
VTGLAVHADYLYLASRSQSRTYRYSLPGIYGMTSSTPFGRNSKTWDIARDLQGGIWAAMDSGGYSVGCFDAGGDMVAGISTDLVSQAVGVAMDDDGTLWVSNNDDGMIYGIDVSRDETGD